MPLIPDYTWQETEAFINVTVEATGLSKTKTDLLICDNFVRVNCEPYLLQLDLLHPVNDAECTAVFGTGTLSLRFSKVSSTLSLLLACKPKLDR